MNPQLAGVLDKIDELALSQADVRRRPRGAPDRGRVEVSGVTATQPPRGDCDFPAGSNKSDPPMVTTGHCPVTPPSCQRSPAALSHFRRLPVTQERIRKFSALVVLLMMTLSSTFGYPALVSSSRALTISRRSHPGQTADDFRC